MRCSHISDRAPPSRLELRSQIRSCPPSRFEIHASIRSYAPSRFVIAGMYHIHFASRSTHMRDRTDLSLRFPHISDRAFHLASRSAHITDLHRDIWSCAPARFTAFHLSLRSAHKWDGFHLALRSTRTLDCVPLSLSPCLFKSTSTSSMVLESNTITYRLWIAGIIGRNWSSNWHIEIQPQNLFLF